MAIRQYIGARYVPRFLGTYSATTIYEALDVVDDGLGTSYIARKTTPAGTPLTDTNYWFVYGASSGAILDLQSRMGIAEGEIDDLQDDVSDLQTETTKLDNKLKTPRNRKYIIIGDSYERHTVFGDLVSEYLGHGTPTFISTNVRKSPDGYIYIASRGGAGFTNTDQGMFTGNGFLDLLTEAVGQMTASEIADIDCILIAGGVNDSSVNIGDPNITMLNTNMAAFKTYALANFPNAQVDIFMLGRVRQLDTWTGRNPLDVRYNIYRYIDLAGRNGFGYITNSEYVCFKYDAAIESDNLHPEVTFAPVIASAVVEGLYNGSVDVTWIDNPIYNITFDSGITSSMRLSCNLVNGVKTIRFIDNLSMTFSPVKTFQHGQTVKIGTQDAAFFVSKCDYPVPFIGWDTVGNKFEMMNGLIRFYGYDVYIVNAGTPTYGGGSVTYDSIQTPYRAVMMVDTLLT